MRLLLEIALTNAAVVTVLALCVAGITRICRRPPVVYALWLLVLLKLITPPLVRIPVPGLPSVGSAEAGLDSADGPTTIPPDQPPLDSMSTGVLLLLLSDAGGESLPVFEEFTVPTPGRPASFNAWVVGVCYVWLAGSVLWCVVVGLRVRRFHRLVGHTQTAPEALQRAARLLAQQLGLKRCPVVRLVEGHVPPMLWAMGRRSTILLPRGLLRRLSSPQHATLLAHELAHARRRDHWIRCLELVVLGGYWWFPVAWWARHRLQQAEEQCCDAWVLAAFPDKARVYARALLETVDFFSSARTTLPLVASGFGYLHPVQRRLRMILQQTTQRSLSLSGRLAVLALGILWLPMAPVAADDARPKEAENQVQTLVGRQKHQKDASTEAVEAAPASLAKAAEAAREKASLTKAIKATTNVATALKAADLNEAQLKAFEAAKALLAKVLKAGKNTDQAANAIEALDGQLARLKQQQALLQKQLERQLLQLEDEKILARKLAEEVTQSEALRHLLELRATQTAKDAAQYEAVRLLAEAKAAGAQANAEQFQALLESKIQAAKQQTDQLQEQLQRLLDDKAEEPKSQALQRLLQDQAVRAEQYEAVKAELEKARKQLTLQAAERKHGLGIAALMALAKTQQNRAIAQAREERARAHQKYQEALGKLKSVAERKKLKDESLSDIKDVLLKTLKTGEVDKKAIEEALKAVERLEKL